MVNTWALLVSIETYHNPIWKPPAGATKDTEMTMEYLLKDRQVPVENIKLLAGKNATRNAIISAFQSHLIDNMSIRLGDSILFHFSGHGTRTRAPANWSVIADDGNWETILAWDDGVIDETGQKVCGIPDRTIGELLDAVARRHGQNITVVLDCCHSSGGIRGFIGDLPDGFDEMYPPRFVNPKLVAPMREDVDTDILNSLLERVMNAQGATPRRRGFREIGASEAVLMAGCGQFEYSRGTAKEGGFFTKNWIKALRAQTSGRPQTYEEMLRLVNIDIDAFRDTIRNSKIGTPDQRENAARLIQHPACEGRGGRIVFTETVRNPDSFIAVRRRKLGENVCRIEAGEVQGIQIGTLFELQELDEQFQIRRNIGSAVAKKVKSTHCIAEYPEGIELSDMLCVAVVEQHPWHLRFSLSAAGSEKARLSLDALEQSLGRASQEDLMVLEQKGSEEEVDLHMEVDHDGGVDFYRRDPILNGLQTKPPRIEQRDVEFSDLVKILKAIARFNWNLALTSQQHPLRDAVSLELHRIDGDATTLPGDAVVGLKERVPIVNGEASIVEDERDGYAFVLKNKTGVNLYPYLVCFDPGTYEVEIWYEPPDLRYATLRGNRDLQIGSSAESREILQFFLPQVLQPDVDTVIMKVYLLDTPGIRMGFMNQEGVLGYDIHKNNNARESARVRGDRPTAESKGQWDTLDLRVTVHKKRAQIEV